MSQVLSFVHNPQNVVGKTFSVDTVLVDIINEGALPVTATLDAGPGTVKPAHTTNTISFTSNNVIIFFPTQVIVPARVGNINGKLAVPISITGSSFSFNVVLTARWGSRPDTASTVLRCRIMHAPGTNPQHTTSPTLLTFGHFDPATRPTAPEPLRKVTKILTVENTGDTSLVVTLAAPPPNSTMEWPVLHKTVTISDPFLDIPITYHETNGLQLAGTIDLPLPLKVDGVQDDVTIRFNYKTVKPGDLKVHMIWSNPFGPDLDGEFVVIYNTTAEPIDLFGVSILHFWPVGDIFQTHSMQLYQFTESILLEPNSSRGFTIATRAGVDSDHLAFAGKHHPVWNNSGDTCEIWAQREGGVADPVKIASASYGNDQFYLDGPINYPNPNQRFAKRLTFVRVPAKSPDWVATGLMIMEDDEVEISAFGTISAGWLFGDTDANGAVDLAPVDSAWPFYSGLGGFRNFDEQNRVRKYALIGKLGVDGTPFIVGTRFNHRFDRLSNSADPDSLELFLWYNDDNTSDGSGAYGCSISVFE